MPGARLRAGPTTTTSAPDTAASALSSRVRPCAVGQLRLVDVAQSVAAATGQHDRGGSAWHRTPRCRRVSRLGPGAPMNPFQYIVEIFTEDPEFGASMIWSLPIQIATWWMVLGIGRVVGVEHQVTGLQIAAGDLRLARVLVPGVVRQVHPDLGPGVQRQPRAVEPDLVVVAVPVGHAAVVDALRRTGVVAAAPRVGRCPGRPSQRRPPAGRGRSWTSWTSSTVRTAVETEVVAAMPSQRDAVAVGVKGGPVAGFPARDGAPVPPPWPRRSCRNTRCQSSRWLRRRPPCPRRRRRCRSGRGPTR